MAEINPAKLELIVPSDGLLNQVAANVSQADISGDFVQGVIDRMLQMSAGKGHDKEDSRQMVGLAAVQLGVGLRIVSIDITADGSKKAQNLHVLINPTITHMSEDQQTGREGCWSCGNICGIVERSRAVQIEGLDRHGNSVGYEFEGFVARIAQHEVDHLNGIRFPDRIPVDMPERLHWVKPEQFQAYRTEWPTWPHQCPRENWVAMKSGTVADI